LHWVRGCNPSDPSPQETHPAFGIGHCFLLRYSRLLLSLEFVEIDSTLSAKTWLAATMAASVGEIERTIVRTIAVLPSLSCLFFFLLFFFVKFYSDEPVVFEFFVSFVVL
jgi:hypothetical protein